MIAGLGVPGPCLEEWGRHSIFCNCLVVSLLGKCVCPPSVMVKPEDNSSPKMSYLKCSVQQCVRYILCIIDAARQLA